MTVDAIQDRVAELTPDERADLLARLRSLYDDAGNVIPDRPDKTGVYSVEQLMARARRSS